MAATERRKPPNAGKGRPKGVPNKMTADLRAMILGALNKAGGEQYLVAQAHDNPQAFLPLVGKCLPKEVKLGGDMKLSVRLVSVKRGTGD